jgi:ribosomal protein L21
MAKTKSSVHGKQTKKIVVVKPYTKKDGTKVDGHRRSTPD